MSARTNHWFNRTFDAGKKTGPAEGSPRGDSGDATWADVERQAVAQSLSDPRVGGASTSLARIAAAADHGRKQDANALKKRLRLAALKTDQVYDDAKAIVGDLHVDGHTRAAAKVGGALFKLKQAEAELEEARELVSAEGSGPVDVRRPW